MPPENGLFRTPEEVREEYKARLKGENGGGKNWYTDRVKSGITRDDDGNIQRSGAAWWLQGLEQEGFADTAADRNKDLSEATKIETLTDGIDLDSLEEAAGGKKITGKNVKSIGRTAEKITRDKPTVTQQAGIDSDKSTQSRLLEGQREGNQLTRESMSDARTAAANQMEMMRLEFAQGNKDRLADRADARDARADDRMMQLEMYERADRKEEKNRRRESIQALVAGLSSLGAAFAV